RNGIEKTFFCFFIRWMNSRNFLLIKHVSQFELSVNIRIIFFICNLKMFFYFCLNLAAYIISLLLCDNFVFKKIIFIIGNRIFFAPFIKQVLRNIFGS